VLSEGGWIGGSYTDRSLTRVFSVFLVHDEWRHSLHSSGARAGAAANGSRRSPLHQFLTRPGIFRPERYRVERQASQLFFFFFFRAKKSLPRRCDFPSIQDCQTPRFDSAVTRRNGKTFSTSSFDKKIYIYKLGQVWSWLPGANRYHLISNHKTLSFFFFFSSRRRARKKKKKTRPSRVAFFFLLFFILHSRHLSF
jgi:hypothetical protein